MRSVAVVLVLAVAGLGAVLDTRTSPAPDGPMTLAESSGAICSVEQGSGRATVVAAVSQTEGSIGFDVLAGGQAAGSARKPIVNGFTSIQVEDVAAVGIAGALAEMPGADSAATSVVSGQQSRAVEVCSAEPFRQVIVAGGSTKSGERFLLHLMNPYSTDATLELVVTSEAGLETNDRFEAITVPTRDSVILDMAQIIPGREVIAVTVEVLTGDVVAVGKQETDADNAQWSGVPAGQDWFIPISGSMRDGRVLVVSPINAPVEFQLDLYSDNGFEESYVTGSVPARGHVWVDLDDVEGAEIAVRVISAAPVVATYVVSGETGVALTNGLGAASTQWLIPGTGTLTGDDENLVILNPGLDTVTVTIHGFGGSGLVEFDLPADTVAEIGAKGADGVRVEATGEIALMWVAWGERSLSLSGGKPLPAE